MRANLFADNVMHDLARALATALCLLLLAACGTESAPGGTSPDPVDTAGAGTPALGVNAPLGGRRPFPAGDPWNVPVDTARVDPRSDTLLATIGLDDALRADWGQSQEYGIPYVVVAGSQAPVAVTFTDYPDESDPGPYPIPSGAPIEGGPASGGDRHVIVIDRDRWLLYELWRAFPQPDGSWEAGSGAVFDLTSGTTRPAGWTSADAAGLPIFPGLARYDEVQAGTIAHALRFTVSRTRRAYVAPARHWASAQADTVLPPMGMRVRLRAGFDLGGYPREARVILQALKTYGMIVADNGSDLFIQGVSDPRWDPDALLALRNVRARDLEVVRMGTLVTP